MKGRAGPSTKVPVRAPQLERPQAGRQAQKSQATQRGVLEAAIRCLVQLGYTNTTMESIAAAAQFSRGAIMHHYESRADVIARTAEFLAERRLQEFESQVCVKLLAEAGHETQPRLSSFRLSAELVMRYYERPSFIALHELLLAARTDRSIAPLMKRIEKHINTQMLALIVKHLPYWQPMPATEAVLTDHLNFLARGVAMSYPNKLDRKRQAALLDLVAEVAHERFLRTLQTGEKKNKTATAR